MFGNSTSQRRVNILPMKTDTFFKSGRWVSFMNIHLITALLVIRQWCWIEESSPYSRNGAVVFLSYRNGYDDHYKWWNIDRLTEGQLILAGIEKINPQRAFFYINILFLLLKFNSMSENILILWNWNFTFAKETSFIIEYENK